MEKIFDVANTLASNLTADLMKAVGQLHSEVKIQNDALGNATALFQENIASLQNRRQQIEQEYAEKKKTNDDNVARAIATYLTKVKDCLGINIMIEGNLDPVPPAKEPETVEHQETPRLARPKVTVAHSAEDNTTMSEEEQTTQRNRMRSTS